MAEQCRVQTFPELADQTAAYKLGLGEYQRGFVWEGRRIRQLVADLESYAAESPSHNYYMGTVLLHRKKSASIDYDVIDGQQRLAALALLWSALESGGEGARSGNTPAGIQFRYRRTESHEHLRSALQALKEALDESPSAAGAFETRRELLRKVEICTRIVLTVIETDSEDQAFALFDSQNSRGVPLETTDLLKAHHLRAIRMHTSEHLREDLERDGAKRWERLKAVGKGDLATRLFNRYLWRGRRWSGMRRPTASRRGLLEEFRDECYPPQELLSRQAGNPPEVTVRGETRSAQGGGARVPCFPSSTRVVQPVAGWDTEKRDWVIDVHLPHQSADPADLPFTLRQPLPEGIGFFLYAERYAELLRGLEKEPTDAGHEVGPAEGTIPSDNEWSRFRDFYRSVVLPGLTHYLRQPFLLASLMYVDRFGDCRLLEFALWLDHVIGAERLNNAAVHSRSIDKVLLREGDQLNLLDRIASSTIPDEVIRGLKELTDVDDAYRKFANYEENGQHYRGRGVQQTYVDQLRAYYGEAAQQAPLGEKRRWIPQKLARTRQKQMGFSDPKTVE